MNYKTFRKHENLEKFLNKLRNKYFMVKYDITYINNWYWLYYYWSNTCL